MLVVASVRHTFGKGVALAAPQFDLAADEHCALIGASGSGKTTLLHILAGILPPSEGTVTLAGENLYTPPRDDRWRAARIGVVPQRLHLIASLSALENVGIASWCIGRADSAAATAAAQLLEALGLAEHLTSTPSQMSQGQQQRVAIARALVQKPRLLLADEPTSALDDGNAQRAVDLLLDAARAAGVLLVVATHDRRIRDRFTRVFELQIPTP